MRELRIIAKFQSTLPTRGSDEQKGGIDYRGWYFNPRSPRGGATPCLRGAAPPPWAISIHAPHEGERHKAGCKGRPRVSISIHAPHEGERPGLFLLACGRCQFQSTLPTRGSDWSVRASKNYRWISIHAPHEGERPQLIAHMVGAHRFQSSLPTRGSDAITGLRHGGGVYISILAPHEGERPPQGIDTVRRGRFQSSLPTRGSDGAADWARLLQR